MGMSPDRARASIRFSLGQQNAMEEVEFAAGLVGEAVARLRELSPSTVVGRRSSVVG
jgi:cysteine desulfurase